MRFGCDHRFWVVVDPKANSTLQDILFQASLTDLEQQFRGGLTMEENPTLFTEREEAEAEATGRLVAMRVAREIARNGDPARLRTATRIELRDGQEAVVFAEDIART